MTLKIYSGKTAVSVNLDDGADLYLARNGWKQSGPNPGPAGVWYDVEEKMKAEFVDASDAERAAVLSNLARLAAEAAALQDGGHRDHLNPAAHVAVEAKTPTESATRWALLRDLFVPELDAAHYGQRHTRLDLELTREGLWRGIKPGLSPTTLAATTITSLDGIGNGTAVTINPANIAGDAPGLAVITLMPQNSNHVFYTRVCRRLGLSTAALNTFTPFLWLEDASASNLPSGLTDVEDLFTGADDPSLLPVSQCYMPGASEGGWASWNVDPQAYHGQFSVMLIYATDSADTDPQVSAYVYHGMITTLVNDEVALVAGSTWGIRSLGQIKIPHAVDSVRGGLPTSSYKIQVQIESGALNHAAAIAGIVLVPDDPPGFECSVMGITNIVTVIDGEIERFYRTVGGNLSAYTEGAGVGLAGPYPTVAPGWYNRFLFLPYYNAAKNTGTFVPLPAPITAYSLNIGVIPRYQYLA